MEGDVPVSYSLRGASAGALDEVRAEVEILRALAAGRNPITGATLPDDSCYQSAKVLRALLTAISALEKRSRDRNLPGKAGKPWTPAEEEELGKYFDQEMPISELARKHERTRGAIGSRLEKMGKIKLYVPIDDVPGVRSDVARR